MIEIRNLSKAYQNEKILDSINLDINKHDFIIIYGESGCGKTTLLQMISGMTRPTSGTIKVFGQLLDDQTIHPLLANEMSYVFQDHRLLSELSVKENIESGIDLSNKSIDISWFDLISRELHITDLMTKSIDQLSTGQRQRVAIARALIKKPSLLLLDEPTGNLDEANSLFLLEFLKKIHRLTDITILLVTHEDAIKSYGNRILYLENKTIREKKGALERCEVIETKEIKIKKNHFLSLLKYVERYTKKHLLYYLFMSFCVSIVCLSFFLSVNVGSNFKDYIYDIAWIQEDSCIIHLSSTHPSGKIAVSHLRKIAEMDPVESIDYDMHHSYAFERSYDEPIEMTYQNNSISDLDKIVDFHGFKNLATVVLGDSEISNNEILVDEMVIQDLKIEDPIGKEIDITLPICLYYEKATMSDNPTNSVEKYQRYVPINKMYTFTFVIKGVIQADYPENYTLIHDRSYLESKVEEYAFKELEDSQFTSIATSNSSISIDHIDHLDSVIEAIESHYDIECSNSVSNLLESVENIDKVQSIYAISNSIIFVTMMGIVYIVVVLHYGKKQRFQATLEFLGASKKEIQTFVIIESMYIIVLMTFFTGILTYLLLPYLNNLFSKYNPIITFTQIFIQKELSLFTLDVYQILWSLVIGMLSVGVIQLFSFMKYQKKPIIEILKWEVR